MRPPVDPDLGVAKKDDDLWIKGHRKQGSSNGWKAAPRIPPRKTLKRIGLFFLVAVALYLFIHNIPTDLEPARGRRPHYPNSNSKPPQGGVPRPNTGQQTQGDNKITASGHDYNGPVRFLELAETLHAISGTKGSAEVNKNVLFVASSLRSAAILLPLACQMGKELRSYVHFALISRSEIPIDGLRDVNGIDDSCQIIFHGTEPSIVGMLVLFLTSHRCAL